MDKERHSNWMPGREEITEIKENMGQTIYVVDNNRRTNALVRRDLLKVDPPNAAEAVARAEEDDRTRSGRPVNPGSFRQVTIRAKAKAKAKARSRRP